MSKRGDRLRDEAEGPTPTTFGPGDATGFSHELAVTAEELADQWDAIELTMAAYLADRA
jgi:hypothetical protein